MTYEIAEKMKEIMENLFLSFNQMNKTGKKLLCDELLKVFSSFNFLNYQLKESDEQEIEEYLQELIDNVPHECDFCDHFSGNSIAPAVRPAWCNNKNSLKFNQRVEENDTCDKFSS